MSGAYTAKPEADVTPDYPEGVWPPEWTFPGPPLPPGYEPEYTLPVVAPEFISVNNPSASISCILYDRGSYNTAEPEGTILWTCNKAYANGPSGVYSNIGDDYYGDGGVAIFADVSVGDVIIITAFSYPFGEYSATGSAEIIVVDTPITNPGISVFQNQIYTYEDQEEEPALIEVCLDSEPSANVTVLITTTREDAGNPDVESLLFTPENYDTKQEVHIQGVDNEDYSVDLLYNITIGPSSSADNDYSGLYGDTVSATNVARPLACENANDYSIDTLASSVLCGGNITGDQYTQITESSNDIDDKIDEWFGKHQDACYAEANNLETAIELREEADDLLGECDGLASANQALAASIEASMHPSIFDSVSECVSLDHSWGEYNAIDKRMTSICQATFRVDGYIGESVYIDHIKGKFTPNGVAYFSEIGAGYGPVGVDTARLRIYR